MKINFIQHAALPVTLSSLYNPVTRLGKNNPHQRKFLLCLFFGLAGLTGMMMPYSVSIGFACDGHSNILTLAGLRTGTLPMAPGWKSLAADLEIISVTFLNGLIFRRSGLNKPEFFGPLPLPAAGVVAHVAMFDCQVLISGPVGTNILKNTGYRLC